MIWVRLLLLGFLFDWTDNFKPFYCTPYFLLSPLPFLPVVNTTSCNWTSALLFRTVRPDASLLLAGWNINVTFKLYNAHYVDRFCFFRSKPHCTLKMFCWICCILTQIWEYHTEIFDFNKHSSPNYTDFKQWRNWRGKGENRPPDKLNVKSGPPLCLYLDFTIVLVFRSLFFFAFYAVFSGDLRF